MDLTPTLIFVTRPPGPPIFLRIALAAAAATFLRAQPLPEGPRLRDLADRRGLLIGTALGDGFSPAGMGAAVYASYAGVAAREFNFFTAENAHKFGRIHPTATSYQFAAADLYDSFARSAGAGFHGHAFVWYKTTSTPAFVVETTTREGLLAVLRDHISAVGARYGPGTLVWDVVNEALQSSVASAPEDWRDALRPADTDHWRATIGTDYIELAFRHAAEVRAANQQNHRLIYNDFTNEGMNNKSLAQYLMARDFLDRGVPLEGLGFQMHVNGTPDYAGIRANFKRLSDLGLDLYITEFDTISGSSDAELDRQAAIFHGTLDVALRNPHFRAFQTWGFTDRTSWLYTWTGNPLGADVRPLPFTAGFEAKPAYYAIQDALAYEFREPVLTQGDFEGDISAWFLLGPPSPSPTVTPLHPHGGARACSVPPRASPATGVAQDVLAALLADQGGAGRYELSGWFRVPSGPAAVRLRVRLTDSTGAIRDFPVEGVAGASWQRIQGWLNLAWSRTLVSAVLIADTPGSGVAFLLDDVALGDGNVLANSNAEKPGGDWSVLGAGNLSFETSSSRRHYGARGLRVVNRTAAWNGPAQSVRPGLLASGQGVYELSGYLRSDAGGETGKLTVRLGDASGYRHFSVTRTLRATAWTRLSGTVELAWPDDSPPSSVHVYAETSTGTSALGLDDVVLRKISDFPVAPFTAWQALHFDVSQRADPSISAPGAFPADDGVANLVKYALGLRPAEPAASELLPALELDASGHLRLEFRRNSSAAVQSILESSPDLIAWSPLAITPELRPDPDSLHEWVSFPLPSSPDRAFYRIRFTLP